jgi:predicted DNA-binding protein
MKQITIKMQDKLYEKLKAYCESQNRTMSEIIRELISYVISKEN